MVTIRPRGDWQSSSQPVVGPAMVLRSVTMLPAHYTAAASVPSDTPPYLRAIQNDYTVNRGYSIGYNFAVDRAGVAWELRGFDIKCAANKGMNDVTIAVLCLVNGADAMNPAMVATFRGLGAEAQRRVGAALLVVGHRDIGATACPGDGIYHQVVSGQLEPGDPPDPTPPTPPTPEEVPMYIATLADGRGLVVGSAVRPVSGPEASGPFAELPRFTPDPGSDWHAWLTAGADEYTRRVGMG